jgi:hypothetical protein
MNGRCTKLGVYDMQLLLELALLYNLLREELLQALSKFAILKRSDILNCSCGRREPMQAFQFQPSPRDYIILS